MAAARTSTSRGSRPAAAARQLVVEGLREGDARTLLRSVVLGRLDERVSRRIIAETRGNPLALLELPRGLSSAELALVQSQIAYQRALAEVDHATGSILAKHKMSAVSTP